MRYVIAAVLTAFAGAVSAADPSAEAQKGVEAAKSRMAQLPRLEGKWKGSGWMMLPQGRSTFDSEEMVESRLDGQLLRIEGFHRDAATKAVVHHAFGLLSWDASMGAYRMSTALPAGRAGSFTGQVADGRFVWVIEHPQAPTRRFTIEVDKDDRWVEVGEMTRDGGKTWMKFFEMTLARVK